MTQDTFYKDICVKIETDAQYDSIRLTLKELVSIGVSFDIYIPHRKENFRDINTMYNKTFEAVKKDGFNNIIRSVSPRRRYHLCLLAPHFEEGINAKYYVKYSYGSIHSVKPKSTHKPHLLNRYHGYIVCNKRDTEIFSVFSKTYLLPDLKHVGYRRIKNKTVKQIVSFLPSWEGQNNLEWLEVVLKELKGKYITIVKLHPYGDFGKDLNDNAKIIKERIGALADEYYEEGVYLDDILGRSDLVVSDVSGAVFDALYVGVPVTMYSRDVSEFDLPGIKSACTKYTEEGYISLSSTAGELVKKIPSALSGEYLKKQSDLSNDIFRKDFTSNAVDSWMKVINLYLNDKVNQEYISMHNLASKEFWGYKNEINKLKSSVEDYNNKISTLSYELNSFLNIKRSVRLVLGNIKRKVNK